MTRLRLRIRCLVGLEHQGALLQSRMARVLFLVSAMALVSAQQFSYWSLESGPDGFYRNVLNLGASYQRYFSFFYYFDGFPVNLDRMDTSTREAAEATLAREGARLRTDLNVYNRASVVLFYPETWLKGRPDTAEMRTGLAIWFTVSLLAVIAAFWFVGMPVLGLLVALLCGSNPFQVHEIYHLGSSTIFSMVISTGLMATAIALILSSPASLRRPRFAVTVICLAAAVCALQYEIRLEGIGGFLGAAFAWLVLSRHSWRQKVAYACLFAVMVVGTSRFMNWYFDAKLATADQIVEQHGGTPARVTNAYYSTQWWALWSGLGDFDEKYGYLADDRAGISYYYGHDTSLHSEPAMRKDYLERVASDPAWWLDILGRRVKRIFTENTPYRVGYGTWHVDLPLDATIVALAALVPLAAALWTWHTTVLTMFVVSLSIGAVSIGQLADYGLQFYSVVHLFVAAYVACVVLDAVLALCRVTPPALRATAAG